MTPAEYMSEIVLPTASEFNMDRQSRRHAYLACIATHHLVDHLIRAGLSTPSERAREVSTHPDDFEIVHAVCNGIKHVKTGRTQAVSFATGLDRVRPPAFYDHAAWDISQWDDPLGGREVSGPSGQHDLFHSVRNVIQAYMQAFPVEFCGCDFSVLMRDPLDRM